MKKSKAKFKRLQKRIASWNTFMKSNNVDLAVDGRRKTGGYRCPGSLKR